MIAVKEDNNNFRKLTINLNPQDWHNYATESVWVEPIGDNLYRIKNVPFYAKSIGYDDTVMTREQDDLIYFVSKVMNSGHSTYRVFINENTTDNLFTNYWQPLENIGCTYEKATKKFIAIDVPPQANINQVYDLLDKGENDEVWEFEEGHCAHI